jgi:hypothetical protein
MATSFIDFPNSTSEQNMNTFRSCHATSVPFAATPQRLLLLRLLLLWMLAWLPLPCLLLLVTAVSVATIPPLFAAPVAAIPPLFAAPVAAASVGRSCGFRSGGCYTLSNSNDVTDTIFCCFSNGNNVTNTIVYVSVTVTM